MVRVGQGAFLLGYRKASSLTVNLQRREAKERSKAVETATTAFVSRGPSECERLHQPASLSQLRADTSCDFGRIDIQRDNFRCSGLGGRSPLML